MPSSRGVGLNCFALLSRANELLFETTIQKLTSRFIIEQFEQLSFANIAKITGLVLDNACVYTSKQIRERRPFWEQRVFTSSIYLLLASAQHRRNPVAHAQVRVALTIRLQL